MSWSGDDWAIAQHYQRHLLNLQLFDGLLGGLVRRLKALGIYDRALVVLTSDHGTAFRAGGLRRGFAREIAADVMRVPLIVKLPRGLSWPADESSAPGRARNVETIDIAPTIADALGLELPWRSDGASLLDPAAPERPAKRVLFDAGTRTDTYPPEGPDLREALSRKIALFGGSENRHRAPRPDRFRAMIGRPVDGLRVEEANITVTLDHAARFEKVNRRGAAVPFDIGGTLEPAPKPPAYLAVALNGTVHAVTRTWESRPNGFMATPPLDAWRQGRNEVDVFLIEGTDGNARLRRLAPSRPAQAASTKARR